MTRTADGKVGAYEDEARALRDEARALRDRACDLFLRGLDLQAETVEPGEIARANGAADGVRMAYTALCLAADAIRGV